MLSVNPPPSQQEMHTLPELAVVMHEGASLKVFMCAGAQSFLDEDRDYLNT